MLSVTVSESGSTVTDFFCTDAAGATSGILRDATDRGMVTFYLCAGKIILGLQHYVISFGKPSLLNSEV